jgi:hypothetical protein
VITCASCRGSGDKCQNLFLLYGPNTNLGTNSIVHMLESQTAYVIDTLRNLEHTGAGYLDLRPEVRDLTKVAESGR